MTRSNIRALLALLFALAMPLAVSAQLETGKPVKLKPPKPKIEKFKGEVLHANSVQITLRSRDNPRIIRTFSLTPELREKMLKIIERGGYQHGDRVEIEYVAGEETARKIKGKPSRSR